MHENQSQTESLLDIVRPIQNDTLLLPEFQRDFRWEMDQTYDLFDSLSTLPVISRKLFRQE
jgi:uncharacterized protein with ParB-like and HNH nuclease domain